MKSKNQKKLMLDKRVVQKLTDHDLFGIKGGAIHIENERPPTQNDSCLCV